MATIYQRMASSALKCESQLTTGIFPNRTFIVQFVYENGLVVNYDGERWHVVKAETASADQ